MCGIVGIAAPSGARINPEVISRMRSLVTHRGPDDNGFCSVDFGGGRICSVDTPEPSSLQLGFTRLSIRDLSHRGHQPMLSDDSSAVILFNGEVYNTDQLIPKYLEGEKLNSTSDTEVVWRLILKLGLRAAVSVIDGIFAIAIYDTRTRTLQLARDRFGVKPIYYTSQGGTFAFASEIKPLLASGIVQIEMAEDALSELAVFRYVAGPNTPFKGIGLLPPGCTGHLGENGELKVEEYWSPQFVKGELQGSVSDDVDTVEMTDVVRRSIRSQLVSDVQVGLELSGGIDSSLIAWAAQGTGLEGYSAIPSATAISEEEHIDYVSFSTDTFTNKYLLTPEVIAQAIGEIAYYHETPINHEGSIGIYLVCQLAKSRGVSVLLSGEGADELFAGYKRYQLVHDRLKRARMVSQWTSRIDRWLPRRFKTANNIWQNRSEHLMLATAFGTPNLVEPIFPGINAAKALECREVHWSGFDWSNMDENHLRYDQKTYLTDLLARQDKLSMAHSVETRVPFLANEIAEVAHRLPFEQKLGASGTGKVLLKKIVAEKFGHEFAYRRKQGFPLPYSYMAESPIARELAKSCLDGLVKDGIAVDASDVFTDASVGDGYADRTAWVLMSIGMWYDIYFRNSERVSQFVEVPSRIGS
jgi:asparagine synthase (glutamine-hydrolysing)